MKKYFLILLFFVPLLINAQLEIEWSKQISSSGNRSPILKLDSEENIIVIGGNSLIKYDKFGNKLWNKELQGIANYSTPGPGNDHVAIDHLDNIYVLFNKTNFYNGIDSIDASVYTTKYTSGGSELWTNEFRFYPDYTNDQGASIKYFKNNIYVAGTAKVTETDLDPFLVSYDANTGEEKWRTKNLDEEGIIDNGKSIEIDSNGDIYIGGNKYGGHHIIKIDSMGNLLWKNTFHNDNFLTNFLTDMVVTANGKIVLSGWFYITSSFDESGDLDWNITPQSNLPANVSSDRAIDVFALNDGGVILTGFHTEFYNDGEDRDHDILTLKIDEMGDIVWTSRYKLDDFEFQQGSSIAQNSEGYLYVGGQEYKDSICSFLINKHDVSNGNLKWSYIDPEFSTKKSRLTSMKISPSGSIYATGDVFISNQTQLFLVKKYKEILVNNEFITSNSIDIKVVPNPTINKGFKVISDKYEGMESRIELFDYSGKEILNKTSYVLGEYIDLRNHESGLYFIRIHINGVSSSKKFILD